MRRSSQTLPFSQSSLPQPLLPIANPPGTNLIDVSHTPTTPSPSPSPIKYAPISKQDIYRLPLPPQVAAKLVLPARHTSSLMAKHESDYTNRVREINSFHTTPRRARDPRKTRTIRSRSIPKGAVLALQLSTTPVISILLLPMKTPANALMTAHTATNAHGHWRSVATSVRLPACITLPCHASELDSRLLRVCVFGGRRGVGNFVIPVRTVLGGGACIAVGKRGSLDVRGVVGSFNGWGIGVGFCAGMSVLKDLRGCLVRVRRVGGARADIGLGEWEFGREGYCRVNIVGEVLWFGIQEADGNVVRLVFQIVKRGAFGGEQIVGEMQIGLQEIENVREGQMLTMAWWRGGVRVALLAIVEMTRESIGQKLLELRVTR